MYSAKIKRTLYLPSKPDIDTRLLLAWSTLCTGQSLDILQLWASSRGDEIYDNLINDFRHKCGLAELALIHVALLALLRLRCFHAKRTEPSGPDSFIRFRQLLEGFAGPSPQAQAVLEEMAWAFNDSLLLIHSAKDQEILALLSRILPLTRTQTTTAIAYFTLRRELNDEDAFSLQVQQFQYRWDPSGLQTPNNSPLIRSALHDHSLQDGEWILVDQ